MCYPLGATLLLFRRANPFRFATQLARRFHTAGPRFGGSVRRGSVLGGFAPQALTAPHCAPVSRYSTAAPPVAAFNRAGSVAASRLELVSALPVLRPAQPFHPTPGFLPAARTGHRPAPPNPCEHPTHPATAIATPIFPPNSSTPPPPTSTTRSSAADTATPHRAPPPPRSSPNQERHTLAPHHAPRPETAGQTLLDRDTAPPPTPPRSTPDPTANCAQLHHNAAYPLKSPHVPRPPPPTRTHQHHQPPASTPQTAHSRHHNPRSRPTPVRTP